MRPGMERYGTWFSRINERAEIAQNDRNDSHSRIYSQTLVDIARANMSGIIHGP
jgi:hypothetical protein